MVVDGYGWLWMIVGYFRWLWVVVDGCILKYNSQNIIVHQQLKKDLELNIILKEFNEIFITDLVEKYGKSMCNNIEARFCQITCKI